jgi:hypothetical protein
MPTQMQPVYLQNTQYLPQGSFVPTNDPRWMVRANHGLSLSLPVNSLCRSLGASSNERKTAEKAVASRQSRNESDGRLERTLTLCRSGTHDENE